VAKRVAILGGGVAGLTVAHELAKWNRVHPTAEHYEIHVFEDRGCEPADLGGKCRSWRDSPPQPGQPGRPGEHGFRFFPGFYKNVIATMREIAAADCTPDRPRTVADHLTALTTTTFYARQLLPEANFREHVGAQRCARILKSMAPFVTGVWLLGGPVVISWFDLPAWWYAVWFAMTVVWKTLRWSVEAAAVDGTAEMHIDVRSDGSGDARHWFPKFVDRLPLFRFWWIGLVVLTAWWGPPWPVWLELAIVSLLWFFNRLFFAQCWLWMKLRGRIPHDVKPRGLESIAMFTATLQLVGSCEHRFYRHWDKRSWWEYVAAYKQSPQYELTLATGLTRTFVATKADRMSARTGGAILAQLIYDLNPYFPRDNPPNRALDGPTSEVWIEPWVRQLMAEGVRFNCFDQRGTNPLVPDTPAASVGSSHTFHGVFVHRLLLSEDGSRIDGFEADAEELADHDPSLGNHPNICVRGEFDHYVMAVPGPSAQRILGSSRAVLERDRAVVDDRPVHPMAGGNPLPFLDGVFELEFGWMTGLVFHLDEEVPELPRGHTLLLQSDWALTGIDERQVWARNPTIPGKGAMFSVDVSDWFRPSSVGLPATYGTIEGVEAEIWRQICDHIPSLGLVPRNQRTAILDRAIIDPDHTVVTDEVVERVSDATMTTPALAVENLPLTNSEKLLVNTAGSWTNRPCALTAIPNLFIAADYVRTQVDFASMESANEAARWAVRALVQSDGHPDDAVPPAPPGLQDPPYIRNVLRCFRFVDRGLFWLSWPNPATFIGAPFSFLSGLENRYRNGLDRVFRPAGLPLRDD
jgi:uncharacterized protein with NAD-binding domain and iron-sulfur cluster